MADTPTWSRYVTSELAEVKISLALARRNVNKLKNVSTTHRQERCRIWSRFATNTGRRLGLLHLVTWRQIHYHQPHTYTSFISKPSTKQAVRLGGRHNMPPPRDFWPFDIEVGVGENRCICWLIDVWFKVAGMSMMISDCPLNSVNVCLF